MKTLLTTTLALGLVTAVNFSQPVAANSFGAGLTSQNKSHIILVRGGGGHGGGGHAAVGESHGEGVGHRGDISDRRRGEGSRALENHPNAARDLAKRHDENRWRRDGAWGAWGAWGVDGDGVGTCVDLNGDGSCDASEEIVD